METHPLARRVLRAVHALSQRDVAPSLPALLAVVPDSPARICATLLALDQQGYLDGDRLRLTLRGFAAVQAPRAVAFERRRSLRDARLRKAWRVA
jgi:hypothetical protein